MKRPLRVIVCVFLLSGCTPDAYQREADLQVGQLVRDRQKQTLAYTPQIDVSVKTAANVTRKSYQTLPTSPIPPTTLPALEPTHAALTYGPLGPEELFPAGTESPRHQTLTIDQARKPALDRLRLGPPARLDTAATLDLFQSVHYAVEKSREYQTHMEDVYLAALSVTLERHMFEPQLFNSTSVNFDGGQNDAQYRSALSITNALGVRQNLPYGGQIVAQGLVSFVNALNDNVSDGESAALALNGSIPLLRGAGLVNLENLISSERNMVYQVRTFEDYRRSFVVNIASQYFNLLVLQSSIINRRINYVFAAQLTEQSNAMYAAGREGTNYLSVQRAESQLYSAENSIITAEDSYQSALDNFKLLLGMPVDEPLNVVPVELDIVPPDTEQDVTAQALRFRLDLQTAADQIEDAQRGVEVAKNGLLPDLNLTGAGTLGNRSQTPARELDSRNLTYSAGITLDLPLDRVVERNAYRKSLINLERAQRNWAEVRDTVLNQVRDAVRAIRSAQTSLEIQKQRLDLAKRRLDYANELLVLGRANDSRDSVEAQNELLDAQDQFEEAKARYRVQILNFLKNEGTLRLNPDAGSLGVAMQRENVALEIGK